jgi:two-component system, NarL family, invasion response regulator UvrY
MAWKILSVDDHGVVLAGLEKLTQRIRGGAIFGKASSGEEAKRMVQQQPWDLVLLDLNLKGQSGYEVLTELREINPRLRVLIFSLHSGLEFVRRSLKLGASGYITKDSSDEQIVHAINAVLESGRYLSPEVQEGLIFAPETASHSELSHREFEVLLRIGGGQTIKEIAAGLNLSENTIETYRARIKRKMAMDRDAELIRYCVQNGLVAESYPNLKAPINKPNQ